MTKENHSEGVPVNQPVVPNTANDLSAAITGTVEKLPGEEVRSIWLYENYYRCNWWVRERLPGPAYLNIGKIIRSKFLRATMTDKKLVIEDRSRRS
jgi:hypothetical protein